MRFVKRVFFFSVRERERKKISKGEKAKEVEERGRKSSVFFDRSFSLRFAYSFFACFLQKEKHPHSTTTPEAKEPKH